MLNETFVLGIDEQLEREEELEEQRAVHEHRLAPVLLPGDRYVEGIAALSPVNSRKMVQAEIQVCPGSLPGISLNPPRRRQTFRKRPRML